MEDKRHERKSNQKQIVDKQRRFFYTGSTLPVEYRLTALNRLKTCILKYEKQIHTALKSDLGKSPFESYMCETGLVLSELTYMLSTRVNLQKTKQYGLHSPSSIPKVIENPLPTVSH